MFGLVSQEPPDGGHTDHDQPQEGIVAKSVDRATRPATSSLAIQIFGGKVSEEERKDGMASVTIMVRLFVVIGEVR
jgi:hypothetical protein